MEILRPHIPPVAGSVSDILTYLFATYEILLFLLFWLDKFAFIKVTAKSARKIFLLHTKTVETLSGLKSKVFVRG